jgi:capsular polysaccharide transport system permease protein
VIIGPNPGISTLKVRAFSADKAREINELLLKIAEEKVNQLNDRARQDLIRYAEVEVRDAEKRAADAALAVATYRNQRDVVNPEQQTQLHLSKISQLQMELLSTRTKLNQLEKLAPNSPAPASLELKQKAIESEIAMEKSRITGSEYSLASMAAEFEKLRLEQEFADRQLALALASLQNARQEAYRQQIYLERLATPSLPDIAMEPERMLAIATVFLLGLICWAVLSILLAGILEHKNI